MLISAINIEGKEFRKLEVVLLDAGHQRILGPDGALTVAREVWTGDIEDKANHVLRIPWSMIDGAQKSRQQLYAQVSLTDSLGEVRSTAEPQILPLQRQ